MIDALKTLRTKQAKRKAAKARAAAFRKFGVALGLTVGSIAALAMVAGLAAIVGHYYTFVSPLAGA